MTLIKAIPCLLAATLGVTIHAGPSNARPRNPANAHRVFRVHNTSEARWFLVVRGTAFRAEAGEVWALEAGHTVSIPLFQTDGLVRGTIQLRDQHEHDDAVLRYTLDPANAPALAVTLEADWGEEANVARVLRLEADHSLTILGPCFQSDYTDMITLRNAPRPAAVAPRRGGGVLPLNF